MSVRSYSPSLSMSVPGTPTSTHRRRLSSSSRRGSTSAPDPWALATFDTPASSTSRLHIVRLPPPTKEELEKYEKEHGTLSRRGSWGSSGLGKSLSMTPASGERVSFAGHVARSASVDQPMRPRIHPSSQTGALAPQQLYDLAMSSIHPRTTEQASPKVGEPVTSPTPAAFTALPPNHYLPFIVRSSEVQQLLSQGPPRRLWALIKQIYPTKLTEESEDPTRWPFWQLERWMFKVDRHEASDRIWVHKARMCISRRSEPLWEKLKNALGVPPELEISDDEDSDDEDLDAVVGSIAGLDVTPKTPHAQTSRPAEINKDEGKTATAEGNNDMEEEEYIDIGPTGLVMEAIYPSAAPDSPTQAHSSPPKRDGGMEIIGEEEEEDEKAAASKPKTEAVPGATSAAEAEGSKSANPADLDTSKMVGLTFISHSKYVPLQQYIDRGEAVSDGEVIVDSPLFPTSFASLSGPEALARVRRGSRGSFVLEQGSMSVRGPVSKNLPRREYAVSTGSESDYDGK